MKEKLPQFFQQLREGLEESIAYSKGELELKTTEIPASPPAQGPKHIVRLRKGLKMSQWTFAKTLNVSTKTVQGWEQGLRKPSQASLRLLQLIQIEPSLVRTIMEAPAPRVRK